MLGNIFRPVGSVQWILKRMPGVSFGFLGCLSCEDRFIAAFDEITASSKIGVCNFWEIIDPPSEYSDLAKSKRDRNRNLLLAAGIPSRAVFQMELFAKSYEIEDQVNLFLEAGNRNVILDISSFPKRHFFPLVKLLLKSKKVENLIVTYSSPQSYHKGELAESPDSWHHLPMFGPNSVPESGVDFAIVGVGFLPFGLPDLLKAEYRHVSPRLFFPFPSAPPDYQRTWDFVRRIEQSFRLDSDKQILRVNGNDPSDAFDHICQVSDNGVKSLIFAPYGPKPMSLAMAIYATCTGSPAYYTQPSVYHPDYCTGIRTNNGVREVHGYLHRLKGRDFYSIGSPSRYT